VLHSSEQLQASVIALKRLFAGASDQIKATTQIIELYLLMDPLLEFRGRGIMMTLVSIIMSSIAFLFVVNRIYFSAIRGKTFRADDYAIVSSIVSILFAPVLAARFACRKDELYTDSSHLRSFALRRLSWPFLVRSLASCKKHRL
jgi:hypothetical protein